MCERCCCCCGPKSYTPEFDYRDVANCTTISIHFAARGTKNFVYMYTYLRLSLFVYCPLDPCADALGQHDDRFNGKQIDDKVTQWRPYIYIEKLLQ